MVTAALFAIALFTVGCAQKIDHTKGVYMLVDTLVTRTEELNEVRAIINYLLGTLAPGDTLAVGRIGKGNFRAKNTIAKVTFDQRPLVANTQKRAFQKQATDFVSSVAGGNHTDIFSGLLQAAEYLNEAGSGRKYILIFSDLKEEPARGHVRDVPFQLDGFNIIAINVSKLREEIRDPKKYMQRVDQWRAKTESGGGAWRIINDLERLDNIFSL